MLNVETFCCWIYFVFLCSKACDANIAIITNFE